ncbi:MAG: hypothetical protein P8184_19525, partial [Calditrichia bacterium]
KIFNKTGQYSASILCNKRNKQQKRRVARSGTNSILQQKWICDNRMGSSSKIKMPLMLLVQPAVKSTVDLERRKIK